MSEREKKNHWINEFDQNKSKHRTMIIGDKSAADTQNLPAINHLLKPMNILFPSCVKIKPWEFSDQKFQWSVSPLMRSAVSVVSLGTADDPWKKQQELSTSTTTWEGVYMACLAQVWPITGEKLRYKEPSWTEVWRKYRDGIRRWPANPPSP